MRVEDNNKVRSFFEREMKNADSKFVAACKAVKIPPTKRQASKWLSKRGLAYMKGR